MLKARPESILGVQIHIKISMTRKRLPSRKTCNGLPNKDPLDYDKAMKYLAFITLLVLALIQPVAAQSFKPDYGSCLKSFNSGEYSTARKHCKALAEQGHVAAQNFVGYMYREGKGFKNDNKKAFRWFRKAAKQGMARAQWALGNMHHEGQGIVQDLVMAYVWFNVAYANGGDYAKNDRNKALKRLNDSERKTARKLSKLCFKQPVDCAEFSYED